MSNPTHNLIAKNSGQRTPVYLTPSSKAGYFLVRTALDLPSQDVLIEYHSQRGIVCQGKPLVNFLLEPINEFV